MKRYIKVLIILFSLFVAVSVNASTKTLERNSSNNYGVNKNYKVTENNLYRIKETKYVDANEKIYDFADILTDSEEKELKSLINKFMEKTKMDFVILTDIFVYYNDSEVDEYAADFYDYNDFAINDKYYSGVLLIRNAYPSDPCYSIYTTGEAQLYFSNTRLEHIEDNIYYSFTSKQYLTGMKEAIEGLISYYEDGVDPEYEGATLDDNGDIKMPYNPPLLIALLAGLFTTGISTKVMVSKNKMVYKAKEANEYLKSDTIKYNRQDCRLVSTNTVSRYDPPSSSSSSGGHSFHGSSGASHGSGGVRHG